MVGLIFGSHAPIEASAEIILKIGGPSDERIVAMRGAFPRVWLIGPIMRFSICIRHEAVASGPTTPVWFFGIVHAGEKEIEESHGVAFLLPMSGVGGI